MPQHLDSFSDRRGKFRLRSQDVLRWKRPGRIEDHKAWSIDRSDAGIGFCTLADSRPQVGELINLRLLDRDRWQTVERTVRVARTDSAPGGELVFVGCALEPAAKVAPERA
ncbi:MAG TPA: hypothetical protein VMV81_01890 [Phycisphaerae bacterium]|nr:hypothetical protein [Phycisphaerae bacterium]